MVKRSGQVFHMEPEHAGRTLATALRGWLPGQSWGDVKKLIAGRRVMVNGNLCVDAGRKLLAVDVVKLLPHAITAPPTEHDVKVRYKDKHVVVVEKPAGVTSTRHHEEANWPKRRKQMQPTLDEMLPQVLARLEGRHKQGHGVPPPVRPVHRLDRETSGLMVFARTMPAATHLMQQFRKHTTKRRYMAVVQGHVEPRTIESHLVRDRGDGRRGSTTLPNVGKKSVTHVKPLEYLGNYTLVECRLETGRTHQIRIHLAELGHPLCGEKVYHQPLFKKPIADHSGAPRIALHAAELGFEHPITGANMFFEMDLPDDLKAFVERLRKKGSAFRGQGSGEENTDAGPAE